jgi:hypothetical protein
MHMIQSSKLPNHHSFFFFPLNLNKKLAFKTHFDHDQTHKPRKLTCFNTLIWILIKINQKLYFIYKKTNFTILSCHQK